jgi:hypothetical protein
MLSASVTGSALTADYVPKRSDVNSVLVVDNIDTDTLGRIAPMGRKFGKKYIAAPLIMTPELIKSSADVFPVEFLDLRLMHKAVVGHDHLSDIRIEKKYLRLQCERELKSMLVNLRQGFVRTAGDVINLKDLIITIYRSYPPIARSVLYLMDHEPPRERNAVASALQAVLDTNSTVLGEIDRIRKEDRRSEYSSLVELFWRYYTFLEGLSVRVDRMPY